MNDRRVLIISCSYQSLILLELNFVANLKAMQEYFTVILLGFHLLLVRLSILSFVYWQLGFPPLLNCLINVLCCLFFNGLSFFLCIYSYCLYNLETNPLSVICSANIFPMCSLSGVQADRGSAILN